MNIDLDAFRAYIEARNAVHVRGPDEFDALTDLLEGMDFPIGYKYNHKGFRLKSDYISYGDIEKNAIHCGYGTPYFKGKRVVEFSDLEWEFPAPAILDELPDFAALMAMTGGAP